ncbi:MAG: L-seryl-tRNA(Sec) selenium transferase [Candidatus Sumerlaeia bacterium]
MSKTKKQSQPDPRSRIPAVSDLLEHARIQDLIEKWTRSLVMDAIHECLDLLRKNVTESDDLNLDAVAARVEEALLDSQKDRLRPVINATGVILHTNLGRAVLPRAAVDALADTFQCCNLQIDMESGERGKRNYMTERLLCKLTGAEAAMVVTNNAAATLLILTALASGREVIISRGQLIEIGGSFRLPDCIHQSGAKMVEIGTTNKTHLRDYENAITEETGLILKCNPSNYRIVGFSKVVPTADLVTLKRERPDLVVVDDLGCGALVDLSNYGLPKEPTVQDSIAAGADIACFSGDKLIGGPQAGIIVGRNDLIAKIKKHPLTRMLRVGKLTDITLEHTLRLFLEPEKLVETNPTHAMLSASVDGLKAKARRIMKKVSEQNQKLSIRMMEGASTTGGGSLPATAIPTWLLAVKSDGMSADKLALRLRQCPKPVIARIANEEVLLDMRTILKGEDKDVIEALSII